MKEQFITKRFNTSSRNMIALAEGIISGYQRQGLTLTIRQLYYQFVARGHIANNLKEYKRLVSVIDQARLAGLIDWSAIEDRTRYLRSFDGDSSPSDAIDTTAEGYSRNPWEDQNYRPEVWIEKDALVGVVEGPCNRLWVPYFACRGYNSQSEQYRAGKRFERYIDQGLHPVILHFGDHDPSGLDMTRDNSDRLEMFARQGVEVRRMALNWDQIQQYNPPPNPAKETDSRHAAYAAQFGPSSWELDALEPTVIDRLISDEVNAMIYRDAWEGVISRSQDERDELRRIARNFERLSELMDEAGLE